MAKLKSLRFMGAWPLISLLWLSLGAIGCHASPDDPKGQSEELADPVRRAHAIENLQSIFHKALQETKGDRSQPQVKAFTDAALDNMVKAYLDYPEDSVNGLQLLALMQESQDPRSIPALIKALDWTQEVTEDHAVTAARAIAEMDVPADKQGDIVAAVCESLERIDGNRGVDNRMRKGFIELLGDMGDKRATPTLIKVVETQDANQNFLFNILAGQQLVKLADPAAIPTMIKALYLFDISNPAMRMNDVATSGLVATGKLSLKPLLDTLAGKNEAANALVKLYIDTVRTKDRDAAARMKHETLLAQEIAITLGKLGDRAAIDALVAEAEGDNPDRQFTGAIGLVGINREPSDTKRIVDTIVKVYDAAGKQTKPQLLVNIRHLYASESMPFLQKVATTDERDFPPVQIYGFVSYIMLANKAESKRVKSVMDKEHLKGSLKDYGPAIAAAEACDEDTACWIGKLKDKDTVVLRKAANMLARYGRGDEKAIAALLPLFGHKDLEVRNEALYAVDYIATAGSKAAVEKIDAVEAAEDGRSSWNNFKREALPTRSRLKLRGAK